MIYSGVHFYSPKQVDNLCFLVVALKTDAETTKLTTPTVQISPISSNNWTLALLWGALTTFPCKFAQNIFLRPGGAPAPPGYVYDQRSLLL